MIRFILGLLLAMCATGTALTLLESALLGFIALTTAASGVMAMHRRYL